LKRVVAETPRVAKPSVDREYLPVPGRFIVEFARGAKLDPSVELLPECRIAAGTP
jgi:hypothetical protein